MDFKVKRKGRIRVVPGYGGRYSVSDLGMVYSEGEEMSLIGGRFVKLCSGGRVEKVDVAYLVARAFVGNAALRPYLRHRDGDRRNNSAENLEWVERRMEGRRGRPEGTGRNVLQFDLEGRMLASYPSVPAAAQSLGISPDRIRNSLAGRTSTVAGEWTFRYE